MTLAEWLSDWLDVYKKPILSKSGYENIERVIRLHLSPELKETELSELNALKIDRALALITSSRMRKYAHGVLNNALGKAYRLDLMENDVMRKVERVRHRQKISRPLSHEEVDALLQRIEKCPQRELFLFYLYTGTRRNEALELRWNDVDFDGKIIQIKGTKSKTSNRVIPLLPEVEALLNRQKARRYPGEKVFPWCDGHVDHVFKSLCPRHKLHDLRHTFITRCAENGINVNVVQALAGHSDVNLTLKVYTHVSDVFQKSEYAKFKL